MRRQPGGASLILVLLLLSMLFVLGLGLVSRAYLGYSTGNSEADFAMAQQLAMAGLEDFRTKASLDGEFPPRIGDKDNPIIYGEELQDSAGRALGRFQVQVLSDKSEAPHFVYQVKSTGFTNRTSIVITGYMENRPGMRWLGFEQEDPDWF
jgi:hypothetical protein